MDLNGRQVSMFRCYRPPNIGPKSDLAHMTKDKHLYVEMQPHGIYVREILNGSEHFIPYANIECIRLEKEEPKVTEIESKRGPGRPWPKKEVAPNGTI